MADDFKVSPHKQLRSFGTPGPYSTKVKCSDHGTDVLGKVIAYQPSVYAPPKEVARTAYKGMQMKAQFELGTQFNKLEYHPAPYVDKSVRSNKGAKGFGSGKPFGRDDISNMLDTIRHRDALEKEEAHSRRYALEASVTIPTSPIRPPSEPSTTKHSHSLTGRLPQVTNGYDRSRHAEEFHAKVPYAERYTRDYGAYRVASREVGEGCEDKSILHAPVHAKAASNGFMDTNHFVTKSISGPVSGP